MIHIALPTPQTRNLTFYLAMEEYVARHKNTDDDCFFMWQVPPTVIFGRNQLIENEVNLSYCREHHIKMYRRKSGGGCVYADMGNVMVSYITRDEQVNMTFNRYVNAMVFALYKLGINAHASGRNDILIEGRKVSGCAFYHIPGHSIVHATLLYDTDMQNMSMSITPSKAKLASKGVESIRQHIALLKDYTTLPLEDVKAHFLSLLCDKEIDLDEEDLLRIEEIEQEYLNPDFIYGNNPRYTLTRQKRIEGVGNIELRMELKNDIIKQVNIMGDFFVVGDIDNRLLRPLRNVPYNEASVRAALPPRLDDLILHLETNDFINLIFKN